MNSMIRFLFLPAVATALCALVVSPAIAIIVVSSDEVWDGVSNPRAGDGVTLAGGVYTIPDELFIDSGASISLNSSTFEAGATPTGSISFDFVAGQGGLTFADATSMIDIHDGDRFGPTTTFTLNMQDNPIQGDGKLFNSTVGLVQVGDSMNVQINSSADIQMGAIDLTKRDSEVARLEIDTFGHVDIGLISTSDSTTGGASAGGVDIQAQSITLGDVDTRSLRADGNADQGTISLVALDPPSFDSNNVDGNNAVENVITLNGSIQTDGPDFAGGAGGSLNVTAVKVVLGTGFSLALSSKGVATINAGEVIEGFTEGDLFMDMAGSGLQANHNVSHSVIPEPGTAAMALLAGLALAGLRRTRE